MAYFCKRLETVIESAAEHPERAIVAVFEGADKRPRAMAPAVLVHDGRIEELRPESAATQARGRRRQRRRKAK